ncbi:MAG: virulence-associated protein E [Hungatella sp.]|nr:virulence-associated protein E [Hungatella sp.]
MIYDKEIILSVAGSRKAIVWKPQKMMWSDFIIKVSQPLISPETLQEYKALPKTRQDELKDVGGYVGGLLRDGRRKNGHLMERSLITLDADNIAPGGTNDILRRVSGLGCAYTIYSTRKHESAAPRLRIVIPSDRFMTAEEYEPVARRLAFRIGLDIFDPTTFEPIRFMYWSSRCADGEWVCVYENKPFLDVEGMLSLCGNWHDMTTWPRLAKERKNIEQGLRRQQDPKEKDNVIGAFCRVYDIHTAIETFIPEIYESCGDGRYTYTQGTTAGGAVLYEDGKFLYSHHATDPAGGKLLNAFDLVRIHKFGYLDEEAGENLKGNQLPSFSAMSELCRKDEMVNREYMQGLFKVPKNGQDDTAWLEKLEVKNNHVQKTAANIQLILENDPLLREKFFYDLFSRRTCVAGTLPWNQGQLRRDITDFDMAGLRVYLETVYQITGKEKIQDAFDTVLQAHASHAVRDYLNGLHWDGVARLDTVLTDYLGAEDSPYTRAVARKLFCAGVARVFKPGIKYDYLVVLIGRQGLGKSTFVKIMGARWYTDAVKISDMRDKTAAEKLQGAWIVELAEMDGFNKTEKTTIKSFLSANEDLYRPAFGKYIVRNPRQSILIGTSNRSDFLTDETGNRRFLPVDCGERTPGKFVFTQLRTEIDQIWAESVVRWKAGESIYLDAAVTALAERHQKNHMQEDPREGMILEFLDRRIPAEWYSWDMERRLFYNPGIYTGPTMERGRICAAEIWVECFRYRLQDMTQRDSRAINMILGGIPGWEPLRYRPGADYGQQRGFHKGVTQSNN